MANDKYSFLPPECSVCGESLTAPVAGMKGKIPMGYCPNCGTPHPLDVESPTEPTEPTTEPGEGGEGSEPTGETEPAEPSEPES